MSPPDLRPVEGADLEAVLALNQAHVPAVGDLDLAGLASLAELAETAVVAEVAGQVVGFVIALPPGVDYASPNYRWFSQRYDAFVYVDRVAVGASQQRRGIGRALYEAVASATTAPVFCCEVNLRPRNEVSLRFHDRLGFRAVGEQETERGAKRVVLLARSLG